MAYATLALYASDTAEDYWSGGIGKEKAAEERKRFWREDVGLGAVNVRSVEKLRRREE